MSSQMTRVISSPCISTTEPALILGDICHNRMTMKRTKTNKLLWHLFWLLKWLERDYTTICQMMMPIPKRGEKVCRLWMNSFTRCLKCPELWHETWNQEGGVGWGYQAWMATMSVCLSYPQFNLNKQPTQKCISLQRKQKNALLQLYHHPPFYFSSLDRWRLIPAAATQQQKRRSRRVFLSFLHDAIIVFCSKRCLIQYYKRLPYWV